MASPGVGPVVAAGWLAATAAGAIAGSAVGGIIGALTDSGVPEEDAHVYAEGVRRGETLVTAVNGRRIFRKCGHRIFPSLTGLISVISRCRDRFSILVVCRAFSARAAG
ncbi:hypothetical protein ABIE33_007054 [Ensifer sp. 4252]